MPNPLTADERERRIVQYLVTLHQGRLAEFRLSRMNRVANFRKQLIQLIDKMIEERAEELAAGMLMEYAPRQPERKVGDTAEDRLPIPPKRVRPVWLQDSAGLKRRSVANKGR